MSRILHIVGSPRSGSASKEIADAYIAAVQDRYPTVEIDILDVWKDAFPEFDEEIMNAKYAGLLGIERTQRQIEAWDAIAPLAERMRTADIIVISVPMWNFGIPYRLKMLIDVVSQNGYLFRFDPATGFSGMATGRGLVVCARGISYATGSHTPETEYDFQKSYLAMWLKLIGVVDVETIVVEQLLYGSEADAKARSAARVEARSLAEKIELHGSPQLALLG